MTITVSIVGLGKIGMGNDVTHASTVEKHPDFTLEGGTDIDPLRRQLFEEKFNCPASRDIPTADLIVIAVPIHYHRQVFFQALEKRPLAILCEKPFGASLAEAEEMAAQNITLAVNYFRRFDPEMIKLAGTITAPIKGRYQGPLINNGSHLVDLANFLSKDGVDLSEGPTWMGTEEQVFIPNDTDDNTLVHVYDALSAAIQTGDPLVSNGQTAVQTWRLMDVLGR